MVCGRENTSIVCPIRLREPGVSEYWSNALVLRLHLVLVNVPPAGWNRVGENGCSRVAELIHLFLEEINMLLNMRRHRPGSLVISRVGCFPGQPWFRQGPGCSITRHFKIHKFVLYVTELGLESLG